MDLAFYHCGCIRHRSERGGGFYAAAKRGTDPSQPNGFCDGNRRRMGGLRAAHLLMGRPGPRTSPRWTDADWAGSTEFPVCRPSIGARPIVLLPIAPRPCYEHAAAISARPIAPERRTGEAMSSSLLMTRRFAPLFWCQFFSAFSDNFLKNALVFLILFHPDIGGSHAGALVTLAARGVHRALLLPVGARRRDSPTATTRPWWRSGSSWPRSASR